MSSILVDHHVTTRSQWLCYWPEQKTIMLSTCTDRCSIQWHPATSFISACNYRLSRLVSLQTCHGCRTFRSSNLASFLDGPSSQKFDNTTIWELFRWASAYTSQVQVLSWLDLSCFDMQTFHREMLACPGAIYRTCLLITQQMIRYQPEVKAQWKSCQARQQCVLWFTSNLVTSCLYGE